LLEDADVPSMTEHDVAQDEQQPAIADHLQRC
jgi:hypothetical protein